MDMKCINVFVGVGTPASTCPCPMCPLAKVHFKDLSKLLPVIELRTFGSVKEWAAKYKAVADPHFERTGKKLTSKEFFSCERDPILDFPDYILILDAVVLPELHSLLLQNETL